MSFENPTIETKNEATADSIKKDREILKNEAIQIGMGVQTVGINLENLIDSASLDDQTKAELAKLKDKLMDLGSSLRVSAEKYGND